MRANLLHAVSHKLCTRCHRLLPYAAFTRSRQTRDGYYAQCRACRREVYRDRRAADRPTFLSRERDQREKFAHMRHWYYTKSQYGVSREDYEAMLARQGGGCAGCGKPSADCAGRLPYLDIDHDHESGSVRGLLCRACNRLLGFVGDNPETLRRLAEYLDSHAAATPQL